MANESVAIDGARCGNCSFAADPVTGEFVLEIGTCSARSAIRLAEGILEGGKTILDGFRSESDGDELRMPHAVGDLLAFTMEVANALSLAAVRGLEEANLRAKVAQ